MRESKVSKEYIAKRQDGLWLRLYPYIKGTPDWVWLKPDGTYELSEHKAEWGKLEPSQKEFYKYAKSKGIKIKYVKGRATKSIRAHASKPALLLRITSWIWKNK